MRATIIILLVFLLMGCTGIPAGIMPVKEFEADRYLGKWYEIARLDHSFERGLDHVTAEYSMRDDGGIRVINKGYSQAEKKFREAEGKAYFVRGQNEGFLKVSFFGPFYGSYIVFELDKSGYQYAFIAGPDKSYLWFLSRTPTVSREMMDKFVRKSRALGFDTDRLIFVNQDQSEKSI